MHPYEMIGRVEIIGGEGVKGKARGLLTLTLNL